MKKRYPSFVALAAVLALLIPQLTHAYTWSASGLDGAGTQNCLAIQPGGTGVILSAADVSGIQRSTDSGLSWNGADVGTPTGGPGKVAVVAWTNNAANANTAYAGDSDGFLTSTDAGVTWSLLSSVPTFDGNGTTTRWPRSTGNLIACDQASSWPGYLYCGAVNGTGGQVMRSTDGGSTWTVILNTTDYIRSLALDPSNTSSLFVATYGSGVYHTTAAKTVGTGGWTQLTAGPNQPEELLVLTDDTLYAAGGDTSAGGGVWKSASPYTGWTKLSGLLTASGTTYLGIAGYGSGSSAVIYVTATNPAADGSSYASVQKTTNGGSTWADITSAANGNVVNQIGGPGGTPWWMGVTGGTYYILGASSGDMANIQIDPSNHDHVFAGGRGGNWGTTNATAATSAIRWYPKVAGLSVCVANWAATDPNNPGRVYVTDEDWVFFYSTDYGATFARNAPTGFGGTGRPIYVDPANSKVYVGTLDDSAITGNVFSNADPTTGGGWTNEGLAAADGNGGAGYRVRGVIDGRDASGNVVILACVDESQGIWRKDGSTWTHGTTSILPSGACVVQFAWKQGSKYVFVYSQGSGLWRSSDYGVTWSNIWSTGSSGVGTGFLAEDPSTDGLLYVSTDSGVFRFTGADTGTPTPTNLGGPAHPGAMTLGNGHLYCANQVSSGGNGSMYEWTSPATSTTSSVISTSFSYPGQSEWPSGLAVDSSGTLYLSEKDEGCMVGSPASTALFSDDFSSGSGNWTADTGTWAVQAKNGSNVYEESNTAGGIANVNVSGSSSWQNYSVQAGITPLTFTSGSVGISLYYSDTNDRYIAQITPAGAAAIKKDSAGTQTTLASGTYTYTSGSTYTVKFSVNSSHVLTMYINGTQVAQATDSSSPFTAGTVALNTFTSTADFDNVQVTQP